jgi:putative tryptophan/tyrosine transport system substrate-binding protein
MRHAGSVVVGLVVWLAAVACNLAPAAHPPLPVRPSGPARVGYVGYTSAAVAAPYLDAFRRRLAELGVVDGHDVVVIERYAGGRYERLDDLVAELMRAGVDVLVTPGPGATLAATRATSTVPIVMLDVGDPVAFRLVSSLERPGGNVTGVSSIFSDLAPVHLDLLRRAVPGASRVVVLWNPANLAEHQLWSERQTTARVFGWQLLTAPVSRSDELERTLAATLAQKPDALYSLGDPLITGERQRVVDFALRHRLATLFGWREFVDAGGLMAYGPNVTALYRQAAGYVARVLRGASPAELPVEQPGHFELVINLRTARAIGVRIPDSVVTRADAVID